MKLPLVLAENAGSLDAEASAAWGLNPFALVEAAGRACAAALRRSCPRLFDPVPPSVAVLAGRGSNAADALVMLRALILRGRAGAARVFAACLPGGPEKTPFTEALLAVQKMNVPVEIWDAEKSPPRLWEADLIIDGITGTGLKGALRGEALAMVRALNGPRENRTGRTASLPLPLVAAVDMPSGAGDSWRPGMPLARACLTLAVEPVKMCLYTPAQRESAGMIVPVGGIFPPPLIEKYACAELVDWKTAAARVPPVPAAAYKYERGIVEIRAGSPGAAGAAKLAAAGAQAAGAGLVRLIVDPPLYPVLAAGAWGVMVSPDQDGGEGRFSPGAALLGPGWGRGPDRRPLLETYLPLEEQGLPLILDADAVILAKDLVFHGNAILTPHPGEFAACAGISKEAVLAAPAPVLRRFAAEKKACVLFKSHVLYVAAPDGRLALVDGMNPALGAGGSGDLLAGLCAGIAARWRTQAANGRARDFDGYNCALAAAALLTRASRSGKNAGRFFDPADLAASASALAGGAWLPGAASAEGGYG